MMMVITNFKGGSAKSMTALQLSEMLCSLGYSVLLVDADAQRHITCAFKEDGELSVIQLEQEKRNNVKAKRQKQTSIKNNNNTSASSSAIVYASVDAAAAAAASTTADMFRLHDRGDIQDGMIAALPGPMIPEEKFDFCFNPLTENLPNNLTDLLMSACDVNSKYKLNDLSSFPDPEKIRDVENILEGPAGRAGSLYLVPGDISLLQFEEELLTATSKNKIRLHGVFRYLIKHLAAHVGCHFVIVDVNPNAGQLNAMFSMSCDVMLIPSFADNNACHSVRDLLHRVLPNWIKYQTARLSDQQSPSEQGSAAREPHLLFHDTCPFIMPILVSNYDVEFDDKGHASLAFFSAYFIKKLELIVGEKEKDANGRVRKLPEDVKKMLYPFGTVSKPQMVIRFAPSIPELMRWSQLYGVSATAWISEEEKEFDEKLRLLTEKRNKTEHDIVAGTFVKKVKRIRSGKGKGKVKQKRKRSANNNTEDPLTESDAVDEKQRVAILSAKLFREIYKEFARRLITFRDVWIKGNINDQTRTDAVDALTSLMVTNNESSAAPADRLGDDARFSRSVYTTGASVSSGVVIPA